MRNKVHLIICSCIIISIAIVISIRGGLAIKKYSGIRRLCDAIAINDTKEALDIIPKIDDVNSFTSPIILNNIFRLLDHQVQCPLVEACKAGNYEIAKELLLQGADPNQCLQGYWGPMEATFLNPNEDRLAIAQLLIEHGAEVNLHGSGDSALFNELQNMAYRTDSSIQKDIYHASILLLLDHGADPVDENGNTVMHYICYSGDMVLLQQLSVTHSSQLDAKNANGQTPLMWAAEGECEEVIEYLLYIGVDATATDTEGKTAYDYAVQSDNNDIIALLGN